MSKKHKICGFGEKIKIKDKRYCLKSGFKWKTAKVKMCLKIETNENN